MDRYVIAENPKNTKPNTPYTAQPPSSSILGSSILTGADIQKSYKSVSKSRVTRADSQKS